MSDKLRCGLENKISCNLRKFLVAGSMTILSILRNYKFTDPFKVFWRHLLHSHNKLSNFQLSTLCDKIISFLLKAVLINLKMYLKFSFQRTLYKSGFVFSKTASVSFSVQFRRKCIEIWCCAFSDSPGNTWSKQLLWGSFLTISF